MYYSVKSCRTSATSVVIQYNKTKLMNKLTYLLILTATFVSCKARQNSQQALIQDCPEEKIVNKIPGPPVKGESERTYYIYQGKKLSPKQFDQEWLNKNCEIKETVVY